MIFQQEVCQEVLSYNWFLLNLPICWLFIYNVIKFSLSKNKIFFRTSFSTVSWRGLRQITSHNVEVLWQTRKERGQKYLPSLFHVYLNTNLLKVFTDSIYYVTLEKLWKLLGATRMYKVKRSSLDRIHISVVLSDLDEN